MRPATPVTPAEVASLFSVPTDNVRRQYAANARQLQRMADHARKVGEYRGKTAAQWQAFADFKAKAGAA